MFGRHDCNGMASGLEQDWIGMYNRSQKHEIMI
jgi:hypothetical protein